MRVVVTDRKYPECSDPFSDVAEAAGAEVVYADCETEDDAIEQCRDADVIVLSKAPITPRVLDEIGETKHIIRIGTGFDSINVKAATFRGVPVSNTPGYSTQEIAEHAVTLMLAASRKVVYSDLDLRSADDWGERTEVNVVHSGTVGIVGLGRIGRAVVPKVRGLGVDVVAYDPYLPEDVFDALDVEKVSFEGILERSDFITVHTPLTAETHQMFGPDEFEAMKDTAVLVNTARGPIVDADALLSAVESGEIWAAGLDVFEIEPPVGSPVLDCDRIVCTPHHGGNAPEVKDRCLEVARQELERVLTGEHPHHVVNPEVLQYTDDLLNPERERWQ